MKTSMTGWGTKGGHVHGASSPSIKMECIPKRLPFPLCDKDHWIFLNFESSRFILSDASHRITVEDLPVSLWHVQEFKRMPEIQRPIDSQSVAISLSSRKAFRSTRWRALVLKFKRKALQAIMSIINQCKTWVAARINAHVTRGWRSLGFQHETGSLAWAWVFIFLDLMFPHFDCIKYSQAIDRALSTPISSSLRY